MRGLLGSTCKVRAARADQGTAKLSNVMSMQPLFFDFAPGSAPQGPSSPTQASRVAMTLAALPAWVLRVAVQQPARKQALLPRMPLPEPTMVVQTIGKVLVRNIVRKIVRKAAFAAGKTVLKAAGDLCRRWWRT